MSSDAVAKLGDVTRRSYALKRASCPPHVFKAAGISVDTCTRCGTSWRDWTRGFASNVAPKRRLTGGSYSTREKAA